MRRAHQIEMENQKVTLSSQMANSQFFKKLLEIPVIQSGVANATSAYGKVKDFNAITHKSFELAENISGAVVCRVTPFAQKGISIAAQPLERIDNLAVMGLENLEHKVPAISKKPEVMMSDVREVVTDTLVATKVRITKSSENVLVSKPIQSYFDFLEFILSCANKTLDKVLPPSEQAEGEKNAQNGATVGDNYPGPEERAERGWWLLGQFLYLVGSAKDRVVDKFRTRIDSTSTAADMVYKQAKKAVNYALPVAADKDTPTTLTTNGDANKPTKQKKKNQEKNSENN